MPAKRAHPWKIGAGALVYAALTGCAWMSEPPTQVTPEPAEAYSLFGEPLNPAPISGEARDTLEARLARARAEHERDPHDPDALIWLGRRTAYLGRHRAAIALYSRGIAEHPEDARFYRHRGHRYITLRRFSSAIADLEQAARLIAGQPDQVEPDGIPNARNTPTSTLHSNVWYHLGLAYYLERDFENARRCWRKCLEFSTNPDMLSATTYWLWQALVRLGREEEARAILEPIHEGMDIIENRSYHRLLLLYRADAGRAQGGDGRAPGDPTESRRNQAAADRRQNTFLADSLLSATRKQGGVDFATVGYGLGSWRLAAGERERAVALFRDVLAGGTWAAFGYIAAEADLKSLDEPPR